MKDSGVPWIGDLPNEWQISKLKRCVAIRKRIAGETGRTVLSITQKGIVPKDLTSNEGQIAADYSNYQIVHPGDFAMNHMDLLTGWVDISRFEGVTSPDYRVFELVDKSRWSQRYLLHLLQTCYRSHIFYGLGQGVSGFGRWRLPADMFLHFDIPCPEISEQQRIADFLDVQTKEVDAAIVKTRESIEEYQKLKQSVITQAVTKGIRPNRNMKDSGEEWIAEIPEEWARVRFKYVFALQKGLSITKDDLRKTGVSVISYGQVHSKKNTGTGLSPSLIRFVDDEYLITHPEALVRIGDFIFADTSEDMEGCGNCVYVNEEFPLFAGYHTVIARPKQPHYFRYFAYQFQSALWRSQLRCRVFGIKVYSVSQKILCTTTALLPPLQEQQEIVAYLDEKCGAIDALIEKKRQIITELESYKKSLIYEYVTGKKEVPA